jgi:hypothetical protein
MTWPGGDELRQAARTALLFHRLPTDLLEHEHTDPKTLTRMNRLIMRGWQILKDETCPRCGVVHWHGKSADNRVEFKVKSTHCYSCAAQDEDQKEHKPKPGENRYVVPQMLQMEGDEAVELPDRGAYLREQMEDLMQEANKEG